MSELLKSIQSLGDAADRLTRTCTRHGALVDSTANDNPFVTALKRSFKAASLTPSDMLAAVGRIK